MVVRRTLTLLLTSLVVTALLAVLLTMMIGWQATAPAITVAEPLAMAQSMASEHQTEQTTAHAAAGVAHSTPTADSTAQAALQMQSLLGHHVTLGIRLMRATVTGDPGFIDAANASLVRHIDDIEAALEPVVGAEQAAAFGERWEQHIQSLFQYSQAVRDDDQAQRRQAEQALQTDLDELSRMLAQMTDGTLPQAAAAQALEGIANGLTSQIDAYAAQDFERAYELEREVYAAASAVGQSLAEAATGHTPGTVEYTPREQLSNAFAMLMGEHVELAVDAMRAAVNGDAEFEAAAGALNANTTAVTDAMSSLFGDDAARRFNELWADHIDLFVDYTAARAADDQAGMTQARDEFDDVISQFGTVLSDLADGGLTADAIDKVLTMHENHLMDQIDLYAEGNYEKAHDTAYIAYQHMRDVALVLAESFADVVAANAPAGGADTGAGGTAGTR